MSADLFREPEGATPLTPDEAKGLIPTWVATRADLNAVEQENILRALAWASTSPQMAYLASLLAEESMKTLHRRMFGDVWKWAGSYRQHDTNMGAHWPHISTQVRDLLADVAAQTADAGSLPWSPDELAVRFHHRLVVIHPFANGNGRHSRLAADLLVQALGESGLQLGVGEPEQSGRNASHLSGRAADRGRELRLRAPAAVRTVLTGRSLASGLGAVAPHRTTNVTHTLVCDR